MTRVVELLFMIAWWISRSVLPYSQITQPQQYQPYSSNPYPLPNDHPILIVFTEIC